MEWWSSLSGTLKFFYFLAVISTGLTFIQVILSLVGMGDMDADFDVDVDVDVDVDADVGDGEIDSGVGMISVRTVMAFFMGFGWAGVACLEANQPIWVAVVVGAVVGQIFMVVVFYLMRLLHNLAEEGNVDPGRAKGQTGTVYFPIPARREGKGQVQVVVQGRMRELDAVTDEEEKIPTGTSIEVVEVLPDHIMVVRRTV